MPELEILEKASDTSLYSWDKLTHWKRSLTT